MPFVWDERTLPNGTSFTLETTIGDIDLLILPELEALCEVIAETEEK